MTWQDLVIGIGLFLLTTSAVPTIVDQWKRKIGYVPYATSLLLATTELVFVIPFWTMEYWTSVLSCAILAILWYIIAAQRVIYGSLIGAKQNG